MIIYSNNVYSATVLKDWRNLYNAEIFLYKLWRRKGCFQFEKSEMA